MTQPATISFDDLVPSTGAPQAGAPPKPPTPTTVSDPQDMGRAVTAKKAEYLSDLEQLYPGLQEPGSGWSLIIERKQPKMSATGQKMDGIIPEHYSARVGNHNILTEEGFRDVFGHGVYEIRVQGPHKERVGPNGYPAPHVYAEIKLNLPQETMVAPYPYPMPQQPGSTVAGDTAVGVLGKLAMAGFDRQQAPPGIQQAMDPATANLAREAMEQSATAAESARIALQQQVSTLTAQLEELNRRYLDAVTTSRSNPEADRYREQAIQAARSENERQRDQYEARIDRMSRDERDTLERLRQNHDDRVQKLQTELNNARADAAREYNDRLDRVEKLAEDRLRNERSNFDSQMSVLRGERDREITMVRESRDRDIAAIKADRERDMAAQANLYQMQLTAKDSAQQMLIQELGKANVELNELRRQVNLPLEQQLLLLKKRNELMEELGGGGDKGPPEASTADKLMAMVGPAMPNLVNGLLPILHKATGVQTPPPAPPVVQGPPPAQLPPGPQQRQQVPPQQVAQRPRPPQQTQVRPPPPRVPPQGAVSPGPVAPPAGATVTPPAMVAAPTAEGIVFRGDAPMSEADLAKNLPVVEEQFAGSFFEMHFTPDVFVQMAEQQIGIQRLAPWVHWVDGVNAVKLLDQLKPDRGWTMEGPSTWLRQVWHGIESRLAAMAGAPRPEVPADLSTPAADPTPADETSPTTPSQPDPEPAT